MTSRPRLLPGLLLVSAVPLYSNWLAEFALPVELSPTASYVSEHSAEDQPHRWFFRLPDVLSGVLLCCAAAALSGIGPDRFGRLLVGGLAALGASTVGVALAPLDCAVSRDEACRAAERAGELSTVHSAHGWLSVLAFLASVAAAFAAERRTRGPRRLAFRLVLATLLATGVLSVALQETAWVGLVQRVQLAAVAVGLAVGASACLTRRGPQPERLQERKGDSMPTPGR
ncbi:Protein of unknown function (DUF998) [Streptoalloteichus tenebrarius]|uniref:DUF998 domain-containing protein n=1 Tax=Streptoalloteichus tenebrarius (strain ATCC 17920 / DSM 40477 / JCM 4838 / CBS 697.72 / NBRC 16177 / NCIMB 11028 / NRRL B-12390 / A12253. 1 / ISP 5477) TaxID=1933 RepID=A0ABT1HVZ1_STRSD|nr:DUF998 domain-containing protein [Streptoalloteichus tenebrarius]MCP2259671.1 Protein of unknown function (DUF998) [Streptoalloteichus tenebrarius]BFF00648.1 hypothetical protein GCM10020241_23230 [Streptoalloteichus tenebrarius]